MFSFNHVTISVKNLKESIKFYNFFGFEVKKEFHNADVDIVLLRNGDAVLELFHYEDNYELPEHSKNLGVDLKTIGNKHFGLGVENIEQAKQKIEKNGIYTEQIDIIQGRLGKPYFFVKDPDGILLEIIEE